MIGIGRRYVGILAVSAMFVGTLTFAGAQSGFDVRNVPRPDGAEVFAERENSANSITYEYPAPLQPTVAATERALVTNGWKPYRTPDQNERSTIGRYKSGQGGLYVTFATPARERSRIYFSKTTIHANLPFPEDATDIIYDENRPYLRCVTGLSIDAARAFFERSLAEEGWSMLASDAIQARWPHARLDASGAYFSRETRDRRQPPVMLTLQRSGERTLVDIRVAPFALPQDLALARETADLPSPDKIKSAGTTGSADSVRREATALVIAELPTVLAFYRREMTLRGWIEQAGASVSDSSASTTFAKPDGTAVLELRPRYDLTSVRLVAQLSEAAVAARARAKKEADDQWMRNSLQQAQSLIEASEAKRRAQVAEASAAPLETLRPQANAITPIPLPDNAAEIEFDGNDGELKFTSPSAPKSVAAFYRETLKPLGWREGRSVINGPTMYSMDFTKGGKKFDMTVMLFAGKAKVTARGSGLELPADPAKETERLEAEERSGFPVPKKHTMSGEGTWTMKTGGAASFRRELNAQVPADIGSVLAFYRRELTSRQWKELPDGAVVRPENVVLAFAAPDGPAVLKLGRSSKETTVSIVVKNPAAAARAGVLPPEGKAKVVLGNLSDRDASIIIDGKTIKVAAGVGAGKTPDGPTLELKPGKYRYVLKVPGKPNASEELIVAANETWGLLAGPGGILPLQVY